MFSVVKPNNIRFVGIMFIEELKTQNPMQVSIWLSTWPKWDTNSIYSEVYPGNYIYPTPPLG